MLFAVKKGLELGYRMFKIYGGTGGRPDHTLANYQTLVFLAKEGACGILCAPDMQITAIHNDCLKLPAYESGTVSVFCMGDEAEGVTIRGLKYELIAGELTSAYPLGVSNSFVGAESRIAVEKGCVLVLFDTANGMRWRYE